MGEHEGWVVQQPPSGLLPNGLLPNEAASVIRVLDSERWMKAEERTAELIACIQPNAPSEGRRIAVADYVQRLISKCFPCQVFTFGSVPLKTYLPDGDIDLTAFSKNQSLKDTWAHQVRDMLENEEKNENAEFRVKEVQYIQAEVKIIKCLVENIVVDISFNQLGGLCTLCFLEEVDRLIDLNHLFKRSIILIKAWCYYESRILGAHHGLISTYALASFSDLSRNLTLPLPQPQVKTPPFTTKSPSQPSNSSRRMVKPGEKQYPRSPIDFHDTDLKTSLAYQHQTPITTEKTKFERSAQVQSVQTWHTEARGTRGRARGSTR